MIAEACNPEWSSVPLVGFSIAKGLAARDELDLTLVSQVRNREALLKNPLSKAVPIHFIDNEWVAKPIYQLGKFLRGGNSLSWTTATAVAWPSYMFFEKMLARQFAQRLKGGEFDLIHRITPLTPTFGSPLARLTKTPMLIGPLNGGLPWPKEYPNLVKQEKEWLVPIRNAYRYLPYYKSTYKHLAGVIAGSKSAEREIPRYFRGKRYYIPENGVDLERFPLHLDEEKPENPFRFVSVGRLVPYKGMDLILKAMTKLTNKHRCELLIIGDGPERQSLEALSQSLGIAEKVTFRGWIQHQEIAVELSRSHAFVFPSLREFGGGVVLEAMAMGLPSIVVDYGGPAELVTPESGIMLPMMPGPEMERSLAQAMDTIMADKALRDTMGINARARLLKDFTWDAKAEKLVSIYRDLLDSPPNYNHV
ncbi:MAG: glycosyltransferase family 4 protein [Verrucomicrobiota bacterium]